MLDTLTRRLAAAVRICAWSSGARAARFRVASSRACRVGGRGV